jgi:hypothetical protein
VSDSGDDEDKFQRYGIPLDPVSRYAAFLYPQDFVLDWETRDPMGSIFQTIF